MISSAEQMMQSANCNNTSIIPRSVWIVTSQECDKHEPVIHLYSEDFLEAKENLEKIALDALKQERGMAEDAHLKSPLYDTIKIEDISQGLTIRYRQELEEGKPPKLNDRVIDMIRIEKTTRYLVVPAKIRTVIKTFRIIRTEPAVTCSSPLVSHPVPVYVPTIINLNGDTQTTVAGSQTAASGMTMSTSTATVEQGGQLQTTMATPSSSAPIAIPGASVVTQQSERKNSTAQQQQATPTVTVARGGLRKKTIWGELTDNKE